MSNELITVVMPALNEESNIGLAIANTLSAFDHYSINGELVVVDDGSTDKTTSIIEREIELDSRVRLTRHDTPQGIGKSFWDAVELVDGNLVLCFQAIMRMIQSKHCAIIVC